MHPLFKLITSFIIGILLAIYFPSYEGILGIPICIILLILIGFFTFLQAKILIFQNTMLYLSFLFILLVLIGYNRTLIKPSNNIPVHIESKSTFEAIVDEMPIESKKSVKTIVRMEKLKDSLGFYKVSEKIILYLQKDSLSLQLKYGDKLLVQTSLQKIKPPKNPYEFDYKNYLKNKHIHYQSYVRSENWICLQKVKINTIYSFAYLLREKLLNSLKHKELSHKESAIASAILLGWSKEIDASTMQSYTTAGITHLLCVSGLHVGILCLLIGYALFPLRTAKQKVLKYILQLCSIWLFAFITGLSPSVLRASIMFSFIMIGKIINRKTHIYNNLATSALFLLFIDPYVITNVGFQLSYVGVLGIVSIQPIFNRFLRSEYKLLNYITELMGVSISAQLATMPFTLYYFHQFPTYFLLANMLIIPFSGVLLGTALCVALFSWVPLFGWIIAKLLSFEIIGMNKIVQTIEFFPNSIINNINFTLTHAVLFSCALIWIILFFMKNNPRSLFISLFFFCFLFFYELRSIYIHKNQKMWTVYHLGKEHTALGFTTGENALLFANENLFLNKTLQKFHINNNLTRSKVKHIKEFSFCDTSILRSDFFYKNGNFIQFGTDKILLFNQDFNSGKSLYFPTVNYIIVFGNPKTTIEDICSRFKFDTLTIAASNSNKNIKNWISECSDLGIPYLSIDSNNAFIRKIY